MSIDLTALASGGLFNFIGAGRREADVIVPVQQQLEAWIRDVAGRIPTSDVAELHVMLDAAVTHARDFRAFVADPAFTDGRASRQSLDAVMPALEGRDAQGNHVRGDGGLIGQLQAAIEARGGGRVAPALPPVQGAGSNIPTIDPGGGRYGQGLASALPQAGWVPPAVVDVWEQITGRTSSAAGDQQAMARQGAFVQWLLIGGVLYMLFAPRGGGAR